MKTQVRNTTTDEPLASEWESESDMHMVNGRLGERLDTNYLGWCDNTYERICTIQHLGPMHIPYAIYEFRFLHFLLRGLLVLRLLV